MCASERETRTLAARLPAFLATTWPPEQWRDVTVLAAVSGGADSVAMLRALVELRRPPGGVGRLIVAHFHHGLRGSEADADAAFVGSLSERLGLESVTGRASGVPPGDEASARNARYRFLKETAHARGARFVAVAHTADDQAETILHRIARGTGIAGLAGMPRTRVLADGVTLIRPLLRARRSEVLTYLEALGQDFRTDATNDSRAYTRNYIRHEIAPRLHAGVNERAIENVLRLGELAQEAHAIVRRVAKSLHARAVRDASPHAVTIDLSALASQPEHLVCELAIVVWKRKRWPRRSLSQKHLRRLAAWLQDAHGPVSLSLPGGILAVRSNRLARLSREPNPQSHLAPTANRPALL